MISTSNLFPGSFIILIALEAGVNCGFDVGVLFQEMSYVIGIFCGSDDSLFQGLESSHSHVAVEGTRACSYAGCGIETLIMEGLIFEDKGSHDYIRMTPDVLSNGVVGNVSTKKEGVADVGRGEGVIAHHDDLRIELLGSSCYLIDIDQFHRGVGWGLDPHNLGVLPEPLDDILGVRDIGKVSLEVVFIAEKFPHVALSTTIDVIADQNMVTLL